MTARAGCARAAACTRECGVFHHARVARFTARATRNRHSGIRTAAGGGVRREPRLAPDIRLYRGDATMMLLLLHTTRQPFEKEVAVGVNAQGLVGEDDGGGVELLDDAGAGQAKPRSKAGA